ncbi:Glycosyl transferase family 2 [Desulfatibacillum alkenivorans DSM 16219]|jgi:glycosyltransferase involved in cell wall biosynthesis|uniref:Glycosyl transferase family 2 n=1 Tax=Desulfatibacillum alkenivorans DSM 16219 TaxID=1121393 RepID=A0A1M6GTT3_9BACT|nr:glycosyltransferase [Desulfatibacillum alkenivorans]SHJ13348.1 Glycosyl transferase family 2 [Desulfatibacillum alkenivorans DSM 16219]
MAEISVIIPTFNRAGRIEKAVESVLAQDYKDFELIVVDDGSEDDTLEILKNYPEVRVLPQERQGVSAARNHGVNAGAGALIAFLDSDDLWLPSKLRVQAEFFNTNPDVLICQTGETWIRRGKRVNPRNRHEKPSGQVFERSLDLCLVSPSAVMMRRSLFEAMGGFDESLPACEDYDLWLRIGCRHPVHLIDEPLVIKHGGHEDQLSAMPGLDRHRIASLVKLLENEPLTASQRAAAAAVLLKKCRIYANGCAKRNRMEEAEFYRALALRYENEPPQNQAKKENNPP